MWGQGGISFIGRFTQLPTTRLVVGFTLLKYRGINIRIGVVMSRGLSDYVEQHAPG